MGIVDYHYERKTPAFRHGECQFRKRWQDSDVNARGMLADLAERFNRIGQY